MSLLERLASELIINVLQHADDLTNIAFALTSKKHHELVPLANQANRLQELYPRLHILAPIRTDGYSEDEQFVRQLWEWRGRRCVICGTGDERFSSWRNGHSVSSVHLCREDISRLDEEYALRMLPRFKLYAIGEDIDDCIDLLLNTWPEAIDNLEILQEEWLTAREAWRRIGASLRYDSAKLQHWVELTSHIDKQWDWWKPMRDALARWEREEDEHEQHLQKTVREEVLEYLRDILSRMREMCSSLGRRSKRRLRRLKFQLKSIAGSRSNTV